MQIEASSAIVVGGASGLGEATVRRLHSRGAVVTVADLNAEKGAALASELGVEFVACDVRVQEQVQAAVTQAAQKTGGLRIAACCAGVGWAQKVAGSKGPHPLLPFETVVQINLIGTFNVLRLRRRCDDRQRARRGRRARRVRVAPPRLPPTRARSARSPMRPPRAGSSP